jgi:hypothetical protein
MADIGRLVCGEPLSEGIAKSALQQLSQSINSFAERAVEILKQDAADEARALGPFFARVLLENSCAALVGRLDTFRILYLSEFQGQPEYEHGRRAKSAFSWFGDVMPPEEKKGELWSVDHDVSKISRALFSRHIDQVCWQPAVENMLDYVSASGSNPFLKEILSLNSENYVSKTKGQGQQLYSTLSKGVHWEFFNSALLFDEATVKNAIRDTCLLVSHMGLTSHFIPTAYASLQPQRALEAYLSFRETLS